MTSAMRKLCHEMAKDERVILIQKHPRITMGIRYSINAFPIRNLRGSMVASLARGGYLTLNRRGYYILTAKGQLVASLKEERKRT